VVRPQAKREAVTDLMAQHELGVTRACGLIGVSRSLYRYEPRRPEDGTIRERVRELAALKRRYGYRRLHLLLRREGGEINHKRTFRVYQAAGLSVRRRKRKRIDHLERQPMIAATGPNQSWSMDFVSDGLANGRKLRCLKIVDDYTKECLAIEVDTSLPGRRVAAVMERLL
jgi:putative transposase